ncbi:MAG: hypothetical protein C4523_00395 [Myxococcales bacterium]|nr:MAG: hypothetical protein C4523_00395 [Myxococcales bacterium]
MQHSVFQTIAVSLMLGAAGLVLGRWRRMPPLLFYMVFGVLAGPTALSLIDTSSLGEILIGLIEAAVAIIIFEAGLSLPMSGLRTAPLAIRRILLVALPLTIALVALTGRFIAGLSWPVAALLGTIIVVTGPTVIGPLLRSVALAPRVDNLFRWESVWADCLAVVASGVVLEAALHPAEIGVSLSGLFLLRLSIGAGFGLAAGWIMGRWFLPWVSRLGDPGLPGVLALTGAVTVFYAADSLASQSGIVASAVAGMVISRHSHPELEGIKHFKDQITSLLVAFLFVLLSAQLDLGEFGAQWASIVLTTLVLTLLIRPAAMLLSLWGTGLSLRERFYVGLIGPRGIIAASVASYLAYVLSRTEPEAERLLPLTFAVIFFSGAIATLLGRPLARWLGVALAEDRTGIIFIGYTALSRELAKWAKPRVDAVIVDSDPLKCALAQSKGLSTLCKSGLSDEMYEELLEQGFRRVLILTPNTALNSLIAEKAQHHVGANRVFFAADSDDNEFCISIRRRAGKKLAFTPDGIDIDRVNEDLESGRLALVEIPPDQGEEQTQNALLLAYVTAGGGVRILRAREKPLGVAAGLVGAAGTDPQRHRIA